MSQKVRTSGIKRAIKKDALQFVYTQGTTQSNNTIFTTDEAMTLVRVVGNVMSKGITVGDSTLAFGLQIVRSGNASAPLSTSSGVAPFTANKRNILFTRLTRETLDNDHPPVHFDINVKGMRKLWEGDLLVFSTFASGSSAHSVIGSLTAFSKMG